MNGAKRRAFQGTCLAGHRQGLFFVVPVDSLVVDSMFDQGKNVAIEVVSLNRYCYSILRGVVYAKIDSKFMLLSFVHVLTVDIPAREMILFRFSLGM